MEARTSRLAAFKTRQRRRPGHRPLAGDALTVAAAHRTIAVHSADPAALEWQDATALQRQLTAGTLTSLALVKHCLQRIRRIDTSGPRINAIIELNPAALAQARALDHVRRQASPGTPLGLLHGLPVLLKDNIATADGMSTTAGSLALAGTHAQRDAHIVTRLRAAGAVILGKTNLSEWANFRSTRSSSGWSSRGAQTLNPHALTRSTSGSSSGAGAAVAAGLCALAVGTETDGSIVSPAARCGIVGFKPTLGLVSRDGIIPIAAAQDTAGPMTRSVADAALLLQVLAGPDPRDSASAAMPGAHGGHTDFSAALRPSALQGTRIGVIRDPLPNQPQVLDLFEQALAVLKAQGAVLVDTLRIPHRDEFAASERTVLMHEFKDGLARYLAEFQPDAQVQTLADVIAFNTANARATMPFFGQELLLQSQACGGLDTPDYVQALAHNRRLSRTEGLDALFAEHRLDAVVAPSGNPAWRICHLLGDHATRGGMSSPFAVAGYPHITVPMGLVADMPVGVSMGALAWQDTQLLGMAYAYEQASRMRRAPRFLRDAG